MTCTISGSWLHSYLLGNPRRFPTAVRFHLWPSTYRVGSDPLAPRQHSGPGPGQPAAHDKLPPKKILPAPPASKPPTHPLHGPRSAASPAGAGDQNTTAPEIRKWSLNSLLVWPNRVWLPSSDGIGSFHSGMTVAYQHPIWHVYIPYFHTGPYHKTPDYQLLRTPNRELAFAPTKACKVLMPPINQTFQYVQTCMYVTIICKVLYVDACQKSIIYNLSNLLYSSRLQLFSII